MRAQALCGRRVGELANAFGVPLSADGRRTKGLIGQLVERALGADPLAGDGPDFSGLEVELKTVPIGPHGRPAESTFVCSIDLDGIADERWEASRLRRRLQHVLWIPVDAARIAPLPQRKLGPARLWIPTPGEWQALRSDWELLVGMIGAGDLERLTAHQGRCLQVRPKAAHSRVRRWAPGADGPQQGAPVGFYLRSRFTAGILRSPL